MTDYHVRTGFYTPSWTEVGSKYDTWDKLSSAFYWHELAAGPADTEDLLAARVERRAADVFERMAAGRCDLFIDDNARKYSPFINPDMRPGRVVAIKAVSDAGSIYGIFSGRAAEYTLDPEIGRRALRVGAEDQGTRLRRKINSDIAVDTEVGSLVWVTLSGAGIPKSQRTVDSMKDAVSFGFLDDISGGEALDRLLKSGAHWAAVNGRGQIVVKDRNFDQFLSAVASYDQYFQFDTIVDDTRIVNRAIVTGEPRRVATEVQTVAWTDTVITIPQSRSVELFLSYVDPQNALEAAPVASLEAVTASRDYYLSDAASGGTNLTSVASVTIDQFANTALVTVSHVHSQTAYLQRAQLLGYPLQRAPSFLAIDEDFPSQAEFETRTQEVQNDLIYNFNFARNYAEYLRARFADPVPSLTFSLKNQYPDILQRDLLDLVHLSNTHTNISTEVLVTGVEETISWTARGHEHVARYETRRRSPDNYFILDHATRGKLDSTNVLGF